MVIVHGTFGDRKSLLDNLSAAMVDGRVLRLLPRLRQPRHRPDRGVRRSSSTTFVDRVLAATGAAKVSMVGHSQGGMMPRYYIKFLGGADLVDDLVGLAPSNHGTSTTGGGGGLVSRTRSSTRSARPASSSRPGRSSSRTSTPTTRPRDTVSYTNITTKYDEVVVPHTSGYLEPGPQTTNLTLQDVCPTDLAEHVQIPMSATAIALTLDALTRPGPADPALRTCG